ncbi:hypothetical protein ACFRCQ_25565 [Cytobacillus firmus]|uniref:hypothetical protein n=1 Tax=Cytobacillus firmus TaxID=1399 RepID=UPI0036844C96
MKYKVLKRFRDKDTKKFFPDDSIYETEDQNRAGLLQKKGFLGREVETSIENDKTIETNKKITRKAPKKSEK